jgi:hypothetical protein
MKTFVAVVAGIIVAVTLLIGGCILCVGVGTQMNNDTPTSHSADTPSSGTVNVVSIDSRVTESNPVWHKYAWILVLKNTTERTQSVSATIEWVDKNGFIIDDDLKSSCVIAANAVDTFTGYALINVPGALNVDQVKASIRW